MQKYIKDKDNKINFYFSADNVGGLGSNEKTTNPSFLSHVFFVWFDFFIFKGKERSLKGTNDFAPDSENRFLNVSHLLIIEGRILHFFKKLFYFQLCDFPTFTNSTN